MSGWYLHPCLHFPASKQLYLSGIKTTLSVWHQRLGHPAFHILKQIVSQNNLTFSSSFSNQFSCNACLSNKSHKLSFSQSTIVFSQPLQTIFSDVWTSPILSNNGFKYYVIFVDHFTRYIWFYPLKKKSLKLKIFLLDLKQLLKNTLLKPSKNFTLTMGVNILHLPIFSQQMVFLILLHHLRHLNTMAFLNVGIFIL